MFSLPLHHSTALFAYDNQRNYISGSRYIILTSNYDSSSGTSTDFVCSFNEPLLIPRYSYNIGLVSLQYKPVKPPTPATTAPSTTTLLKVKSKQNRIENGRKIFPNLKPSIIKKIPYRKTKTDIRNFQKDFNNIMKSTFPNLILSVGAISKKELFSTLQYENTENPKTYVILPYNLTTLLGYTRYWFLPGLHDAAEVFSQKALDKIPLRTDMTITTELFQSEENLISISQIFNKIEYYQRDNSKGDDKYTLFCAHLNRMFKEANISFELAFDFKDKKITLAFEAQPNEYVVIPSKLANMLGFNYDTFQSGTHMSGFDFDQQSFDSIADGETLFFRFGVYFNYQVGMAEPSNLLPRTVVNELNKSLIERLYPDAKVQFNIKENILKSEMNRSDIQVKLPAALSKYFGISESIIFEHDTSIEVGPEIAQQEEDIETQEEYTDEGQDEIVPPHPGQPSKRLLVLCNIIENQYRNNRSFPVLRELDLSTDYINETKESFSSIVYIPVTSEHVQQLRITLVDEYGQVLNFDNNPTTVELHLKPRIET